ISPDFQERAEQIPFSIKIDWSIKVNILSRKKRVVFGEKAMLKKEHGKVVDECLFTSLPQRIIYTQLSFSMLRLTDTTQ
ncbi:hypothetical protein EDC94DRAFT_513831, partial [Helicostylum pulchrum]